MRIFVKSRQNEERHNYATFRQISQFILRDATVADPILFCSP